ncbi:ATP-binding protein [Streptomyces sp. TLI_053]|uniref:ATP-binding protein n=1 Tax=Streptomyces sp. TLI_053 TaxID=1855352 RepID=UPI001E41F0E5|nr:ATP-binding protein [Streptomyces sp. TLI_053]
MTYDAGMIVVLEGLEAVRARPWMHIGPVDERALHQLVLDAAEPALDEALNGTAGRIGITLTADGGVTVADDGRGHPVGHAGHRDGRALEECLSVLCGGVPFVGRRSPAGSRFAAELSVVNALSSHLTAEVRRDGSRWVLEYERGVRVGAPVRTGADGGSGTAISFRPDPGIFGALTLSFDTLADRFRELAFLNRDLDITLTDDRHPGRPRSVRFRYPGGVRDRLAEQGAPPHPEVLAFERECPDMEGTVEVALCWADSHEEQVTGYANSRPTTDGGTHQLGFRDGLAAALTAVAGGQYVPTPARLGPGLTAIVSVKLDRPEFEGAARARLSNGPVRTCVADAVREHATAWLRADPARAAAVLARLPATTRD